MGAMWQVADVRSTPGFAGGFTLEKGIFENKTNFFSLAIKGRGLFGSTYGLDYTRNYDVKMNPALNGKYNSKVNYDSTNDYIYNNYRTEINEGALELQICFNRLRERTNVLLNIWGGIGFTSYRTKINLLDATGGMYNYRLVDSTGGQGNILSSHEFLLDNTYESNARNSQNGNVLTWSPSCGLGLGYRFNDFISLLCEHKITFPQGTYSDYLDGIQGSNNDWIGCVKDYYHYSSLTLQIRLGGKSKSKSTSNVNNYTPVQTNTIVNIPTNTVVTSPTTSVVTTEPIAKPPVVTITNPPSSPYNETVNNNFPVSADVYNVSQRSQLNVTFNGAEIKNYSWNGKTIQFAGALLPGNNIVAVTATNTAGKDSKSTVIVYSGLPPQITITTPGTSKMTSTQSSADIFATILNVESSNYISVKYNGQAFSTFSYNPVNKVFAMNVNLATGTNTIDITATNSFGQDFKSQLIVYNPALLGTSTATASRPVKVTIIDPAVNPYKSSGQNYKIKAKVTGVADKNQITVTANGVTVPFNYAAGNVDFDVLLNTGNNLMSVSARSGKTSDSKSTVITYDPPKKITPPTVVIINPNPSPYTSNLTAHPFKAQTTNISNQSQLEVKFNGELISNYTFDANTGTIDYNANLTLNSNNFFEIKATNQYGVANASAIVKQEQPKTKIICHRKGRGTAVETITIFENEWAAHQAHGDYEGPCQVETPDPQITICHNNANGSKETITIPQSTWSQHQAHGDVMGVCPKINETPVEIDNDITICHKNADGSKQTIVVKQSTWAQHQAHGDVMGTCPKIFTPKEIDNDITICHKNTDGSKQTIVVKQSTWAQHQAHGDVMGTCPKIIETNPSELDLDITICHKNNDGTETKMTIKQSQWAAHQAHGDYIGGTCAIPTNTAAASSTVEICHNNGDGTKTTMVIPLTQFSSHRAHGDLMGKCPPAASNTNTTPVTPPMTICHNNGDGSKTTMTITAEQWSMHRGHGDGLGVCPTPTVAPVDKKITICHIPPGNNQNPQTIEINESAWPAHQAHGDTKGVCPTPTVAPVDKKITICHIPPGNNQNPQTIEINESAWPAHQAHGDTKGVCPTPTVSPSSGKIQICHLPPGNNKNPQTIEIPESAWPAHEAHGDAKMPCTPNEKKITICHIPPGNTSNPQTIEIAESAWPAHQAHGDTKGACAEQKTNPGKGKGGVKETDNGGSKGRTTQTTTEEQKTTEPQKIEGPKKLTPR
jgi:hypothetical protein